MPRYKWHSRIVPFCESGHDSNSEKFYRFSVPFEEKLSSQGEKAIPRKEFVLKGGIFVCHKHFLPADIIWKRGVKDPAGNVMASKHPFTVARAALKFRPTKRIKIMAQPRFIRKKYDPLAKWRKKLHRALNKPGDWERHAKVLERIAKPKTRPSPPPPELGDKRKYNPKKVDQLAQPVVKQLPPIRKPFKVHPGALKYEITDIIRNLAVHKHPRQSITPYIPGKVKKSALKFVANERYNVLATPLVRPPGNETDLKENAFDVSPASLKAWCSPRIKSLAKPKSYGK